jgi:hypothetical protein
VITRYFLRRYAQAKRNAKHVNASVSYSNAVMELSLLLFAVPTAALFSTIFILSSKAPLVSSAHVDPLAARSAGVSLFVVATATGYFWLKRSFRRYLLDPSLCTKFDSERDRKIVYWQRFAALMVGGVVVPWLVIAIARWVL